MSELSTSTLATYQQIKTKMKLLIEPVVQAEGLTAPQAFALHLVALDPSLTVGALSEELVMGQANTSTLCKKLEQGGYLIRSRSTRDERVVTLAITPKGRGALERLARGMADYERRLQAFSPSILEDMRRGMTAANQALDYLIKGDHASC
jgi:DNA-binding MarR family transcriptional regulator